MYHDYKSSDVSDLHLDLNVLDPNQFKAEEKSREFIVTNAADPKSYRPIKFGNLGSVKVYAAEENFDLDSLKQELQNDKKEMFERLLDKKGKQRLEIRQYALPHTFELRDKHGVKHRYLSNISLDSNLTVIGVDIDEDWIIKFWNEQMSNAESWDALFNR